MTFNSWRIKAWTVCGIALASFAAGSLLTARLAHLNQVRADSNRVFELRVYHTVPGKASALQAEFRDKVTKLFARHDLKAVGYWAPEDAPVSENTFVYILAHPSRDKAKEHWDAFRADPEFQEMTKSQQGDNKLVEKVDSTYMDPTDFSPMK
jgi:NIPSNAP